MTRTSAPRSATLSCARRCISAPGIRYVVDAQLAQVITTAATNHPPSRLALLIARQQFKGSASLAGRPP